LEQLLVGVVIAEHLALVHHMVGELVHEPSLYLVSIAAQVRAVVLDPHDQVVVLVFPFYFQVVGARQMALEKGILPSPKLVFISLKNDFERPRIILFMVAIVLRLLHSI
jgi:hypothetical protein